MFATLLGCLEPGHLGQIVWNRVEQGSWDEFVAIFFGGFKLGHPDKEFESERAMLE